VLAAAFEPRLRRLRFGARFVVDSRGGDVEEGAIPQKRFPLATEIDTQIGSFALLVCVGDEGDCWDSNGDGMSVGRNLEWNETQLFFFCLRNFTLDENSGEADITWVRAAQSPSHLE